MDETVDIIYILKVRILSKLVLYYIDSGNVQIFRGNFLNEYDRKTKKTFFRHR